MGVACTTATTSARAVKPAESIIVGEQQGAAAVSLSSMLSHLYHIPITSFAACARGMTLEGTLDSIMAQDFEMLTAEWEMRIIGKAVKCSFSPQYLDLTPYFCHAIRNRLD
jgi:hypothetical protein